MSVSFEVKEQVDFMSIVGYDSAVIGPYELTAAARLIDQELQVGTFGKP